MSIRGAVTAMTFALGLSAGALSAGAMAPAAAQVVYQTSPYPYGDAPFLSDPSPYDQAYGTRPSFEIVPTPNPYAPAVRVVERCLYPDGWNVTDFSRDLNGIPPGYEHACPAVGRARVRSRY